MNAITHHPPPQSSVSEEEHRRTQYATVQANIGNVLTHPAYAAMRALDQWFVFRLRPHKSKPRKLEKVPVALNGAHRIDLTAPANWVSAVAAVSTAQRRAAQAAADGRDESYTAGFCITADDDINLVDLDKAHDGKEWSPFSLGVFNMFPGAPFEVSVGLDGMHVLPRGRVTPGHANDRPDGLLEVYSEKRGVALTGISATGDSSKDYSHALAHLIEMHLPAGPAASTGPRVAPSLDEWNAKTEVEQDVTIAELRSALTFISAESRSTWVDVGFALRGGLPEEVGFDLWVDWSRTASTFTEDGLSQWETFNTEQTSYKSVFKKAEAAGWKNPRKAQPRMSIPSDIFGVEDARIVGESPPTGAAVAGVGGYTLEEAMRSQTIPASRKLKADLFMVQAALQPCGISVRFDRFLGREIVCWDELGGGVARPLEDDDRLFMRRHLESRHNFKEITDARMADAIRLEGLSRQYDSAIEWLGSLPAWDGVPRVAVFLPSYLGARPDKGASPEETADTEAYLTAVGCYAWTAAAGRILVPGIKADACPVLVGPQGVRKSSAISALAPSPEMFGEIDLAASREDRIRGMRGKLVIELPELSGLNRRESEEIKAFLSSQDDEFVEKYKSIAKRHPRRSTFWGSTNEPDFLSDTTGNRRWLPVEISTRIDVDAIKRDRDQLWAEAAHLFRAYGVLYQSLDSLAVARAAAHTAADPWDEAVSTWLEENKPESVSAAEVLKRALYLTADRVSQRDTRRVGDCLRRLGWEPRTVRQGSKTGRRFVRSVGAHV